MAIVPTGVGNDFARHLGLDAKNPLVSLDLIKPHGSGVERKVDLGKIHFPNGKDCVFTTVAHTGVDGAANEWANGVRFISGTLLYVLAVLRTLFTYRPKTVTVRVGEVAWTGAAWLVAVGNTRNYAGGMIITPGAEVDDGWLEVCLIKKSSLTRLATCFPSVFRGTHIRYPEVEIFRGEKIEIESEGDIWANGELAGPLPATVTTMKRVLRIIGPVT
jgi:diacylglycerol kinase (ATP)